MSYILTLLLPQGYVIPRKYKCPFMVNLQSTYFFLILNNHQRRCITIFKKFFQHLRRIDCYKDIKIVYTS